MSAATHFRVGGIAERDNADGAHVEWAFGSVRVGDKFSIKVISSTECDEPTDRRPTQKKRTKGKR